MHRVCVRVESPKRSHPLSDPVCIPSPYRSPLSLRPISEVCQSPIFEFFGVMCGVPYFSSTLFEEGKNNRKGLNKFRLVLTLNANLILFVYGCPYSATSSVPLIAVNLREFFSLMIFNVCNMQNKFYCGSNGSTLLFQSPAPPPPTFLRCLLCSQYPSSAIFLASRLVQDRLLCKLYVPYLRHVVHWCVRCKSKSI